MMSRLVRKKVREAARALSLARVLVRVLVWARALAVRSQNFPPPLMVRYEHRIVPGILLPDGLLRMILGPLQSLQACIRVGGTCRAEESRTARIPSRSAGASARHRLSRSEERRVGKEC